MTLVAFGGKINKENEKDLFLFILRSFVGGSMEWKADQKRLQWIEVRGESLSILISIVMMDIPVVK